MTYLYLCVYVSISAAVREDKWQTKGGQQWGGVKERWWQGWVEKGEETQRGKLSLICLSRGIFGLPLAINLVTSLCCERGMSSGWGHVCVFKCSDRLNCLQGISSFGEWHDYQKAIFFFLFYCFVSGQQADLWQNVNTAFYLHFRYLLGLISYWGSTVWLSDMKSLNIGLGNKAGVNYFNSFSILDNVLNSLFNRRLSTRHSRRSTGVNNEMVEFHLSASVWGSWYCSCWLTAMFYSDTWIVQRRS